jgi:hypothetical protein
MSLIGNTSSTQSFTPAVDFFSGNASTTAFTLSRSVASVYQVEVVVANVVQNPSSAYTVSNNTITFTSAPPTGTNNVYVRYTSLITQTIVPGQGTVGTQQLGNITNVNSGANAMTLQTNGTTALTIDTSQKVGIGTPSPVAPLHVAVTRTSSTNATVMTLSDNVTGIQTNGVYKAIRSTSNGGPSISEIRFLETDGTNNNTSIAFATQSTAGALTERMRITQNGYVTRPYQPAFCAYYTSNINIQVS